MAEAAKTPLLDKAETKQLVQKYHSDNIALEFRALSEKLALVTAKVVTAKVVTAKVVTAKVLTDNEICRFMF